MPGDGRNLLMDRWINDLDLCMTLMKLTVFYTNDDAVTGSLSSHTFSLFFCSSYSSYSSSPSGSCLFPAMALCRTCPTYIYVWLLPLLTNAIIHSSLFCPADKMSSATSSTPFKFIAQKSIFLAAIPLAFLLQIAHPDVARSISASVLDRLRWTMIYLRAISRRTEERARLIAPLKRMVATADYPANVQLQRWLAAAIFVAVVKVQETFCGGFTKPAVDRLYMETSQVAGLLGVPTVSWPDTVGEFWVFWNDQIDTLMVTEESKSLADRVLHPKEVSSWGLWLLLPLLHVWLTHWVPPRQRKGFGFQVTLLNSVVYKLSVALVSVLYPVLPLFMRHYDRDRWWHLNETRYAGRRKSEVERSFMVEYDE